jgi:hypothetical protein
VFPAGTLPRNGTLRAITSSCDEIDSLARVPVSDGLSRSALRNLLPRNFRREPRKATRTLRVVRQAAQTIPVASAVRWEAMH